MVGRPSCNGGTKYLYDLVNWRQVVLIPDKDKPGIDGAESVAKMLKVKTKQVKIVEPRGACTDAKEWVVGGLRREQLDIDRASEQRMNSADKLYEEIWAGSNTGRSSSMTWMCALMGVMLRVTLDVWNEYEDTDSPAEEDEDDETDV